MRIGIIGAGSIGSLLVGCLSKTSANLLVYGRGLHAAHLTASGLTFLVDGKDDVEISPSEWEMLLEEQGLPELVRSSCDTIIMTCKSSAFAEHLEVANTFSIMRGLSAHLRMVWVMRSDWFRPLGRIVCLQQQQHMALIVQNLGK